MKSTKSTTKKPAGKFSSAEEIQAIVDAVHENVFAFLGMHAIEGGGGVVVRVFNPYAGEVSVVAADGLTGTATAPARRTPNSTATKCGVVPARISTRLPGSNPRASRPAWTRRIAPLSSA